MYPRSNVPVPPLENLHPLLKTSTPSNKSRSAPEHISSPECITPVKQKKIKNIIFYFILGEPTNDVGDIQYVGVVVGAICIALFTLFSCLTIISARRSNHRNTTRRTLPSASCQEEDDRPDVVADNAPPSYDAGTSTGRGGGVVEGGSCV